MQCASLLQGVYRRKLLGQKLGWHITSWCYEILAHGPGWHTCRQWLSTPNPPHHHLKQTTRMETFLANQAQRPTRTISNWVSCVDIPCKHKQTTQDPRHGAQGVIFQVQRNTGCSAQVCCKGVPHASRLQCRCGAINPMTGRDMSPYSVDLLIQLHAVHTQGKADMLKEITWLVKI